MNCLLLFNSFHWFFFLNLFTFLTCPKRQLDMVYLEREWPLFWLEKGLVLGGGWPSKIEKKSFKRHLKHIIKNIGANPRWCWNHYKNIGAIHKIIIHTIKTYFIVLGFWLLLSVVKIEVIGARNRTFLQDLSLLLKLWSLKNHFSHICGSLLHHYAPSGKWMTTSTV